MKLIAISLGLEINYFEKRGFTQDSAIQIIILNYPKIETLDENDNLWGVGEHTDYGFLTLLY